ncbi:MAG: hypothetical protein Q9204_008609, partial [Flavoplaca sp. TL-2023a]
TKHEKLAIPNEVYETPVEEPKLVEVIEVAREAPAPVPLSYEEALPIEDDSGTYYDRKDTKKGKKVKKSRLSEYAAPEEPPPVPIQEDVVPHFGQNNWLGFRPR